MKEFIKLERGKPYPLPVVQPDAAVVSFLEAGGNVLQVSLDLIGPGDEWALRNGLVKAWMLAQDTAILFLFQFITKQGEPLFSFDCPFDARLIPSDSLRLPCMETAESRLLFMLHAVDGKGILRALRGLTLPLSISTGFLSAAMDQISFHDESSRNSAARRVAAWQKNSTEIIIKSSNIQVCVK